MVKIYSIGISPPNRSQIPYETMRHFVTGQKWMGQKGNSPNALRLSFTGVQLSCFSKIQKISPI
jgi:hypothetical protein